MWVRVSSAVRSCCSRRELTLTLRPCVGSVSATVVATPEGSGSTFKPVADVCSYFFFFSSRRRHTRFKCDWSSDVCSSDLSISEECQHEACDRCPGAFHREDAGDQPVFCVHVCHKIKSEGGVNSFN